MAESSPLTRRRIRRRLQPLLLAVGLQNFVLWFAIAIPFFLQIGLSATQIAMLAAAENLVIAVFNVPFGLLADRWGRKNVLLVSIACSGLASAAGGFAHGFVMCAVLAVASGLFVAASSGVYDSVVYDTVLEESGNDDAYTSMYGRFKVIEGVSLATSSLLGGVVAVLISERATFFVSAPTAVLALLVMSTFREPQLHKSVERGIAGGRQFKMELCALLRDAEGRWVAFSLAVVSTTTAIMSYLDQFWLVALSMPLVLFGPANAMLLASQAVGGYVAGRTQRKTIDDVRVSVLIVVSAVALLVPNLALVVVAQWVFLGGLIVLAVSHGRRLHRLTPSTVRSSMSSAVVTAGLVLFLPLGIAFGNVTNEFGVFVAAWIPLSTAVCILASTFRIHVLVARSVR